MGKPCFQCQGKSYYNRRYDSYYCHECDIWLESHCSDENCHHCNNRGTKPSEKIMVKKDFYYLIGFKSTVSEFNYFTEKMEEIISILHEPFQIRNLIISKGKENEMTNEREKLYHLEFQLTATIEEIEFLEYHIEDITSIINERDGIDILTYQTHDRHFEFYFQ